MNAREIQAGLAGILGDRVYFLGCHDHRRVTDLINLARKQVKPCVFILNTLSGSKTMGHWITVYLNFQSQTIGYYDSYNLHPKYNSAVLHHFMQTCPHMKISTLNYRLQGLNSLVCGIYCMFFCLLLSWHTLKRAMCIIHATFKKHQYHYNDKRITRMAYVIFRNMPHCMPTFCPAGSRARCRNICKAVIR